MTEYYIIAIFIVTLVAEVVAIFSSIKQKTLGMLIPKSICIEVIISMIFYSLKFLPNKAK